MTLYSFVLFAAIKSRFFHHAVQEVLYFVTCIYHRQPEYAFRRNLQHLAALFDGYRINSREDSRHDIKVFLIDRCSRFHVSVLATLYDGIHFFADNQISLSGEDREIFDHILEALNDDEDVDQVYHNLTE